MNTFRPEYSAIHAVYINLSVAWGFIVIEQIKSAIHEAAVDHQKLATFLFQVLKNAKALETLDPLAFCRNVGVPKSYATEFRKMLAVARVMRDQGAKLS